MEAWLELRVVEAWLELRAEKRLEVAVVYKPKRRTRW